MITDIKIAQFLWFVNSFLKKVEKLFQLILINTVPADSVEMRHIILDLARTALLGRLHDLSLIHI